MLQTQAPHGAVKTTQTPSQTAKTSCYRAQQLRCDRVEEWHSRHSAAAPARFVVARAASLGDEVAASELVDSGFEYGLSCSQGLRESMEDELCVVEFASSIYAGASFMEVSAFSSLGSNSTLHLVLTTK